MSDNTQSPASATKPKKKVGFAAVKARLEEENRRLREQLAAVQGDATTVSETSGGPVVIAVGTEPPETNGEVKDPLAWIDNDVNEVHFIARIRGMRGRRAIDDQRGKQSKTFLNAHRRRAWGNCPFKDKFTSRNPKEDANLKALNAMFWCITLSREFAEQMYHSIDSLPKRAPIAPDEFEGLDLSGRPKGRMHPITDDPLREVARYYLQSNHKNLWFDTDRRAYEGVVDPKRPNPYGVGVETLTVPSRPGYAK